jgi:hypothetical protein
MAGTSAFGSMAGSSAFGAAAAKKDNALDKKPAGFGGGGFANSGFGSYSSAFSPFAKKAGGEDKAESSSFGDILKDKGGDAADAEEKKPQLDRQDGGFQGGVTLTSSAYGRGGGGDHVPDARQAVHDGGRGGVEGARGGPAQAEPAARRRQRRAPRHARRRRAARHPQHGVIRRHVVLGGRQARPHDHLRGGRAPLCDH